jgi:hypothetical protein
MQVGNPSYALVTSCSWTLPANQTHLRGVGGVVQQLHVHALHAICAVTVGASQPVHLILGGGASVLPIPSRPHPAPKAWIEQKVPEPHPPL